MGSEDISITELHSRSNKERLFSVKFFGDDITTTVTSTASVVRKWITTTRDLHRYRWHSLVVGLGVQWNPYTSDSESADTLQLCVGRRCLIFQLTHTDYVPKLLRRFLNDQNTTFVGIWNHSDESRLLGSEHSLSLSSNPIDLRYNVAEKCGEPELKQASMETLVERFFDYHGVTKDGDVAMSDWDHEWLSEEEVLYAAIDAYVSFRMGKDMSLGSGQGRLKHNEGPRRGRKMGPFFQ